MLPAEIRQLKELIDDATKLIYEKDQLLINHNAAKRALVFRFGLYFNQLMQQRELFFDCEVDVEYNPNARQMGQMTEVHPNLVLHKRGTASRNLLAMEFEIIGRDQDLVSDEAALKKLTEPISGHFVIGAMLLFGKTQAEIHYFRGGKQDRNHEPMVHGKNNAEEDL